MPATLFCLQVSHMHGLHHGPNSLSLSKAGATKLHVYSSTHSHWLQIFTHTLGQSLLFVSLLDAPAKLHDVKIMAI